MEKRIALEKRGRPDNQVCGNDFIQHLRSLITQLAPDDYERCTFSAFFVRGSMKNVVQVKCVGHAEIQPISAMAERIFRHTGQNLGRM
jgi:hypothetical protein